MRTGNLPANMKKARVIQIIPCKINFLYRETSAIITQLSVVSIHDIYMLITQLISEHSSVGGTQELRSCLDLETGVLQIITTCVLKRRSFNFSAWKIQVVSKPVTLLRVGGFLPPFLPMSALKF